MYKKSFYLTAVLGAAMLVGCQPDPTPIDSTWHKHDPPKSNSLVSSNHNGSVHSDKADDPLKTAEMNHSGMNHDAMNHSTMQSAPNAASQPFDLQFLDTMVAHHEGAIEMAKAATTKAGSPELKTLAAKMVADQTREIAEMKRLREQFYAGKPSALNMEMAGMADSMKGMDVAKMNAASGNAFDIEFINQMTPHHQGAIVMAREALTKAEHAELKTLANQIIAAQETEIKQMQEWKTKLAK